MTNKAESKHTHMRVHTFVYSLEEFTSRTDVACHLLIPLVFPFPFTILPGPAAEEHPHTPTILTGQGVFESGGQKPLLLSSLKASFPSDDNETADLTAGIYFMVGGLQKKRPKSEKG